MLLVLQIAQYEAVALEVKKLLLVLFWTVFRIMPPGEDAQLCMQEEEGWRGKIMEKLGQF